MWITFAIALTISLLSAYFCVTAHNRRSRILEGLIAVAAMMICLGMAPIPVKVLLLVGIFAMEQWRVRWETAHESSDLL
ncbi:MAG: hypothetical protein ABG776_09350 [Cyanobacteria bacterium J06555_13]